ncbi:MAG: lysostaphin resistance A-like protein [Actinomycetota bacterium]
MRLLFTIAVASYNNVANLWPVFNRWAYVPVNLLFAGTVVVVATTGLDLALADAGMAHVELGDVAVGTALGLAPVVVMVAGAGIRPLARLMADERVAHLGGAGLAYQTLVRIPLGTALGEEIVFRGVLFGLYEGYGVLVAALVSSSAFALWHGAPTLNLVRANRPDASPRAVLVALGAAFAITFVAGLFLCWLRVRSGGVAAPTALHAFVNAGATVAGVRAQRAA